MDYVNRALDYTLGTRTVADKFIELSDIELENIYSRFFAEDFTLALVEKDSKIGNQIIIE